MTYTATRDASVVNVSDWSLTTTIGGRVPGSTVLVGIAARYILLYIFGGIIRASLLVLFNGPTPKM